MFKIKLAGGLTSLVIGLILMAVPANAEFESTTGKSQGNIKTFPAVSTFQAAQGGPTIECKSTNSEGKVVASGGWQIQVKGTTQQGKFFYQAPTLKGPHEQLKIEKWGICFGPALTPVTIACNLQVESNGTNPSGTGSIYPTDCNVKIGTGENICTVNLNPNGNRELQGVKLVNGGVSLVEIGSEVSTLSSISQESKELCKTLGIKGEQKGGHFKTNGNLITEGQKLV